MKQKLLLLFALLVSTTMAWGQTCSWDGETKTLTITGGAVEGAFWMFHGDEYEGLETLVLGEGVTSIGEWAFSGCTSLATVTFDGESQLESIGEDAFTECSSLASITIPSSVTSIGAEAFNSCTNCTDVYCYADPSNLTWNDGDCNDFKSGKATQCHVFNASAWSSFTENVNVTFVTDLTATVSTNQISSVDFEGYWATYYNSLGNMQAPEGVTVYKAVKDGSSLTLTEIADRIITAGQGVVLKKAASGDVTLTVAASASADDYTGNSLTGVNTATTISTSAYASKVIYTLANETEGLGFYKYYDNVSAEKHPSEDATRNTRTLGANKAFLALESAASARGFTFTFDDGETTRMRDVRSDMEEGRGEYYNLNGQRIAHPTKGLYIKDGKKIMVK